MVKGSGMRIKVRADSVHIHAKANHQTKRLGFPVEGGEDEAHLLFSGACRFGKPSGLFPISQANRRRQRQLGSSLQEVLRGSEIPVYESIVGHAVGTAASVDQLINKLDLDSAPRRDRRPCHQPKRVSKLTK